MTPRPASSPRPWVLVLTVSPWDEPKRLRKQLTEVLAHDFRVVYVTLPYGLLKPKHDVDRQDGEVRVVSLKGPPLPLRWLRRLPVLRALHAGWLGRRLHAVLSAEGSPQAVFCFTADHPALLAGFPKVPIIYVANDDHAGMAPGEAEKQAILRNEAEAIGHSERIVSVSEVIARKLSAHGKPVHVMYPGHDCEALPLPTGNTPTDRQARSLCFFGYIDWRIDFDLLDFMMARGWKVTLIGPVVGMERSVAALSQRFPESFTVSPAIGTDQVPGLLSGHSVLIMPYRYRTAEQAEVMELPNKTFIYFSALRPVVATWMPNLKMVAPGLIYRAATPEEFLQCCQQALQDDSIEHAARRQDIARHNTWDARRAHLHALIDGTAPALA